MQRVKSVGISYWFKKLNYNPCEKIKELEKELESLFHVNFLYNEEDCNSKFAMPRIQALSIDKSRFFSMSLINVNYVVEYKENRDIDEIILEINNNIQLLFDTLKEIYNLQIIYTSIKIEMVDECNDSIKKMCHKLNLNSDNYESLSFKKGIIKDDYYINYSYDVCKEYNFNLESNNLSGQDAFDSTMLISLSEAKKKKEYILFTLEINDRYIYNINANHETEKETIRGMIIELKDILKNIE